MNDKRPFYTGRAYLSYDLQYNGFPVLHKVSLYGHPRWYFERTNDALMLKVIKAYFAERGEEVPAETLAVFDNGD